MQQGAFNYDARAEQQANLARVNRNIAGIVTAFCRERLHEGREEFRMAELTTFVNERSATAPDSAGRILRDLRRNRVVDYTVVNRAQSLYKVTGVSSE